MEEVLYRGLLRRPDPESDERIGSVPAQTRWVTSSDGTKLYTRCYGPEDAPTTFVFAHGIVENHLVWHYQLRDLAEDGGYRLVAYDHRGHGNSGPARGPDGRTAFSARTLAEDMVSVIDETTSGPVILVGHSLGGMASLVLLADVDLPPRRERVAGAVIVCSSFTAQLGAWRESGARGAEVRRRIQSAIVGEPRRIDRWRPRRNDLSIIGARAVYGARPSPRHVAVTFHMFETTSSQTLAAAADLLTFDVYDLLGEIDVPTLVIGGSRDLLTPPHHSEVMAERIPGAELVMLDGCGHIAPFERHAEVSAQLRKFAASR